MSTFPNRPPGAPKPSTHQLVSAASRSSVYGLFREVASRHPERPAISVHGNSKGGLNYAQLLTRVDRLAAALRSSGIGTSDRIALLSENRCEFLEILLAAAKIGACVACQNWRLKPVELKHCLTLVEPSRIFVSARHAAAIDTCCTAVPRTILGKEYNAFLQSGETKITTQGNDRLDDFVPAKQFPAEELSTEELDPETPLLILYTSGTTGLPKGAVLSHRAEIFRNLVVRAEFGVAQCDTFVAWSPLYHMGAAECSLGTLMAGGKVIVLDGFDATQLAEIVANEQLGWLLLMPGMVERLAEKLEQLDVRPRGVKLCGVMADLVAPAQIARITRLLDAPFANTFGATETGCPPCSSNRIPIGVAPERLSKDQSPFCEVRLVDTQDQPVPTGTPGELCIRGLTLFSGYFRADAANAEEFRNGWFHMGDVFVRNEDGTLDFVDRVKYLIKSGGENIYPAEIERILLGHPEVVDAVVVRRKDSRWGEVPVAFVASRLAKPDPSHNHELKSQLYALCRENLAGYKQPKELYFVKSGDLPRSTSGKIQRHELEKQLPQLSGHPATN